MITAHLYDIKRWRVKASIPILNDVHDTELGKTLAFPTFFIKNTLYDPVTQKYQQSTRIPPIFWTCVSFSKTHIKVKFTKLYYIKNYKCHFNTFVKRWLPIMWLCGSLYSDIRSIRNHDWWRPETRVLLFWSWFVVDSESSTTCTSVTFYPFFCVK